MRTRGLRSNTTAAAAGWLCALLLVLVGCHDSNSNVTGDSSSVPQPAANERAEPGKVAQEADQVPIAPGAGQPSSAKAPVPVAATEPAPQFTQERLEQLVAPVALYPDPLLMDVLMAATYPAEVAEAAAWVKQNPGMNGKALDDAIADKGWDVSVNSLTHATQAIELMGQDPQWTSDLGEAFLAQQNDVLNAVQVMRSRACDLGHLKTNAQQRVEIRPAPPPPHPAQYIVPPPPRIVAIYPVQPELLYVPVYNPGIIFGPPPPVVFYPRAYVYPGIAVGVAPVITFGVGVAIAGLFWGDVDWHHHHSYRRRYDSGYYYGNYGGADYWRHDVYHRRGYNYRQPALEQRYGHASRREWSNRDQYRGPDGRYRGDAARYDRRNDGKPGRSRDGYDNRGRPRDGNADVNRGGGKHGGASKQKGSRDGTASVNDQRAGGQRPHGRGGDKGKVGSQRGDGAGRPGSNGPSKNVGGSKGKGGPDSGNRRSSAGRGGGGKGGGGGGQHGGASRGGGGQRGGGGGGGKGGGGKGKHGG